MTDGGNFWIDLHSTWLSLSVTDILHGSRLRLSNAGHSILARWKSSLISPSWYFIMSLDESVNHSCEWNEISAWWLMSKNGWYIIELSPVNKNKAILCVCKQLRACIVFVLWGLWMNGWDSKTDLHVGMTHNTHDILFSISKMERGRRLRYECSNNGLPSVYVWNFPNAQLFI